MESVALPIGRKGVRGLAALRGLLARRKFDVVNTHSSTDSWLAALARAMVEGAPPIVRTRHISATVPANRASRWLYAKAARVVTTGERLREQVIAETGIDPRRAISVPTGIDLAVFHPGDRRIARAAVGLDLDAPIVGIVATLRSWKGHRYLMQAVAAMRRTDVELVIVGDGPQRDALEELGATLGIQGQVRFTGNQALVAPWLQSFDVFCLPSYANEGVPQALMQAMACALPVVTTAVGSINEIVTHGDTGIIVPAQNDMRLRVEISNLLDDRARRAALGSRAHAEAHARFGEALMVERMIEVFAGAAANG